MVGADLICKKGVNQMAKKRQLVSNGAVCLTSEFARFLEEVIGGKSKGKSVLVQRMRQHSKNAFYKAIRVDDWENVHSSHTMRGVRYEPWKDAIHQRARERRELFFTPNSFYGKRSASALHSLRACWVDLDNHDGNIWIEDVKYFCRQLKARFTHDGIPLPYFVFSGRGIHLYWPLFSEAKKYLSLWKDAQAGLSAYVRRFMENYPCMEGWSVDTVAQDPARLMRVPGTYNLKAKRWSYFICSDEAAPIRLSELYSVLVDAGFENFSKQETLVRPRAVTTQNIAEWVKSGAAEMRLFALISFAERRGWFLQGYRNTFVNILASTLQVIDYSTMPQEVERICSRLCPSQTQAEIQAVIRTCAGTDYFWRNETICERLGMSEEEREAFLFDTRIGRLPNRNYRYGVRNRTRDASRKLRKQEKALRLAAIPRLIRKGLTLSAIAEKLGVSLSTVKRHKFRTKTKRHTLAPKHLSQVLAGLVRLAEISRDCTKKKHLSICVGISPRWFRGVTRTTAYSERNIYPLLTAGKLRPIRLFRSSKPLCRPPYLGSGIAAAG